MHYANGRKAKNGDKILQIVYQEAVIGVLYDAVAGNDYCNGKLAPIGGGSHVGAWLADCVHMDDVMHMLEIDLNTGDIRKQLANIPNSEITV